MITFGSLLGGEDLAATAEEEVPQGRRHAERLAEAESNAEADAIRHAEALLQQVFPIIGDSETTAETELARIRTEFHGARGKLETARTTIARRLESIERSVQNAEGALRSTGIPEGQIRQTPGKRRRFELRQVLVAAAAALALGILLASFTNVSVLVATAVIAGAALAIWATLTQGRELEPEEIVRMREAWSEADQARNEAMEEHAHIGGQIEHLERTTYTAAELEVVFADKIVTTYVTTVFSSLPAGTLENGRSMQRQPQPRVQLPDWALALAPPEPEEG